MAYKIKAEPGYIRAELRGRETVEETQEFLRAVVRENAKHQRPCVLISVRLSKPVFQVAAHRLIEYFAELSGEVARRIALVGDTRDLHMSHEYIELLARQRGLDVQSFGNETAALEWLKGQSQAERSRSQVERSRQREERRERRDRRELGERRRHVRRAGTTDLQPA